ncbi:hypothetical protein B0A55_10084 [Friedmanniomyces simplex]|uniref:Uncharacterized protein n=1 Tax=Friedmanniomyces simplex TaxID=329884 RepID=A0A4U0WSE0_9PEZI|nr:hypothetical protein B0A55_10084 [Friedmanniomyces simplex]
MEDSSTARCDDACHANGDPRTEDTSKLDVPGVRVGDVRRWVHAKPTHQERAMALARITALLDRLPMIPVEDPRARKAKPSRRVDSAVSGAGPSSSSSSCGRARSVSYHDFVRNAMEAMTLIEKEKGKPHPHARETQATPLRRTALNGQPYYGQRMAEARERVMASREAQAKEVEEWELVEEDQLVDGWVFESEGMVVPETMEFE